MKKLNFQFFVTFSAVILCFLSVAYMSCNKKTNNTHTCENVYCVNGGACSNGVCLCPNGYEGTYCDTAWSYKFAGTWKMHETVTSANLVGINKDSTYIINISQTFANTSGNISPTALFINHLLNNALFSKISCTVDATKRGFSLQAGQVIDGGNLYIVIGSGALDITGNTITGGYVRYHLSNVNLGNDTLTFTMTRQ